MNGRELANAARAHRPDLHGFQFLAQPFEISIALTGDYDWNTAKPIHPSRPLRAVPEVFTLRAA